MQDNMLLKKLYDKVLEKSSKPKAELFLGTISFCESSFFPIPPDILLLPMVLARPHKWIRIALITTIFSVLGGVFGYLIGVFLWDLLGEPIIHFYNLEEKFDMFKENYNQNGAIIVFIAGISPIPFKLITIASGGLYLNIYIFLLASFISRGFRFFILAGLLRLFGKPAKRFIEDNFTLATSIIGILLVLGVIIAMSI